MTRFKYPTNYVAISQYFSGSHKGLDLAWNSQYGGKEVPIYASCDGTVYATKDFDRTGTSWGNYVKISHGNNTYTLYAHLKEGSVCVKKGDKVMQGQQIGNMGNTGKSNGNHCHFEIYEGGAGTSYRVDPLTRTYVYSGQNTSSNESAKKRTFILHTY